MNTCNYFSYDELIYYLKQEFFKLNYQFDINKFKGYIEYIIFDIKDLSIVFSSIYLLDIEDYLISLKDNLI